MAYPLAVVPTTGKIGYPQLTAVNEVAFPVNHFLEDKLGQRIHFHHLESTDLCMPLHIGLAAKNENLKWLGIDR